MTLFKNTVKLLKKLVGLRNAKLVVLFHYFFRSTINIGMTTPGLLKADSLLGFTVFILTLSIMADGDGLVKTVFWPLFLKETTRRATKVIKVKAKRPTKPTRT